MDVTTDGFGIMLSFGDLVWVPFVYSFHARYLAFTHFELGHVKTMLVLIVHRTGYYIFRASNSEKDSFRKGKNTMSM